jgi:hypothetical protein
LGSSPFARHYSGSRDFFPFLRVLRCFSSPACLTLPYVFRQEYARITTRRFPHSEIPGSTDGQLLPEAYRSRPRPSSALGAKAFTVCPCSLDSKEHVLLPLWSFQGAREPAAHEKNHPQLGGLSKLNSVTGSRSPPDKGGQSTEPDRGRRNSRRAGDPDGPKAIDGSDAYRSKSSGIP